MAQRVKNLPAIPETQFRSLGWEDPLEKEMATHSSILAWRIPWKEEPDRLQSTGLHRVGHWVTTLSLFISINELRMPCDLLTTYIYVCIFATLLIVS